MRLSPRTLIVMLYIFFFILLFVQVLSAIPLNEATLPYIFAIAVAFVVGLALVFAWDYIIPMVFRSYKLGECRVEDKRFIVCAYRAAPEYTGYVMLKVIPSMPIADMPKERREAFLQAILGLLSGAQYEVTLAFVGMKDRYHDNIIKRLQEEKGRLLAFARGETLAVRDVLSRIDSELRILRQVPVILEGFYIAVVREYDRDPEKLKIKLEADSRALASKLEGLAASVKVVEGEELKNLASYLLFGSVVQLTI